MCIVTLKKEKSITAENSRMVLDVKFTYGCTPGQNNESESFTVGRLSGIVKWRSSYFILDDNRRREGLQGRTEPQGSFNLLDHHLDHVLTNPTSS